MKKIFYFVSLLTVGVFFAPSCSEDNKNPGDFNIASELKITQLMSLVSGETLQLNIESERDTIYRYRKITTDTIVDPVTGEFQIDDDGNYVTKNDTIWPLAIGPKAKGKIVELEPVILKWEESQIGTVDTFRMNVASNARWKLVTATVTNASGKDYSTTNDTKKYYANINGTLTGNGNSYVEFECNYLPGNTVNVVQPIITNDSSVYYLFKLQIRGKNYKPLTQ